MKYEGEEKEKVVYTSELIALVLFAVALVSLLLPSTISYLKSIG